MGQCKCGSGQANKKFIDLLAAGQSSASESCCGACCGSPPAHASRRRQTGRSCRAACQAYGGRLLCSCEGRHLVCHSLCIAAFAGGWCAVTWKCCCHGLRWSCLHAGLPVAMRRACPKPWPSFKGPHLARWRQSRPRRTFNRKCYSLETARLLGSSMTDPEAKAERYQKVCACAPSCVTVLCVHAAAFFKAWLLAAGARGAGERHAAHRAHSSVQGGLPLRSAVLRHALAGGHAGVVRRSCSWTCPALVQSPQYSAELLCGKRAA